MVRFVFRGGVFISKLYKYSILFPILFSGIAEACFAQISIKSTPPSFSLPVKNALIIPKSVLDSINPEEMKKEDLQSGIPNRFAISQEQNIDIIQQGVKTKTSEGTIFQYRLRSPGAISVGIIFSVYNLPEGAELFIYNPEKTRIAGAFTSLNNKQGNPLPIAQFEGEELIIEYFEPEGAEFNGELTIGAVLKAYLDLQSDGSEASTTQIGINCPEGENWQSQKRSVCLMSFTEGKYGYYCTGFLVNNTREDRTPYFMTANHCISTNTVASTLVTYFNDENSSCSLSDASLNQSLSGAVLKATNPASDFTLLELSEYPPDEYKPYYAGWNASSNQPANSTCIHHPQGEAKCIAIDNDAPVSYTTRIIWEDRSISESNTHWEVGFDSGTTESGSSGSPLFDNNKRVIGQLHGGNDVNSFYGKFSVSWNYNSTQSKQLYCWLDPGQTGKLQLDGMDYNQPPAVEFSSDVTLSCLETPVLFTDESLHMPTSWLWKVVPATCTFENGTDSTSQNPAIRFLSDGIYSITLIAFNKNGSDTIEYKNLITATATLPVVFQNLADEENICGCSLDNYKLIADGAPYYNFEIEEAGKFTITTSENILTLDLNDEYKKQGSFDTWVKVTGNHGSCYSSDSVLFHVIIPENDYAENAVRLNLGLNPDYSNLCGTTETNEPHPPSGGCLLENNWCPDDTLLNNSIWFTFTGPSSGLITIETSGFDNQIAVYESDSYSNLLSGNSGLYTLLAANDDCSSSNSSASIENLVVESGRVYWLQLDGNNSQSGSVSIRLLSNTLEIAPNPTSGEFSLTLSSLNGGVAIVGIYNIQGKLLLEKELLTSETSNRFSFDVSAFAPGIYIVRAVVDGLSMSRRLLVIR